MDSLLFVPPEVLMGEAGICPFLALVAVAHVYQRNRRMTGWQAPNKTAVLASILWPFLPDPTDGARFVFSAEDLKKPGVRGIIRGVGPPKVVYPCVVGRLVFY